MANPKYTNPKSIPDADGVMRHPIRQILFVLVALVTLAGVVICMVPSSLHTDEQAAPIFVTKIPPGYRDWRLISVAHEEGELNDIRAILGNDIAIKAYREGNLPFPDGTIIARLAWSHDASGCTKQKFETTKGGRYDPNQCYTTRQHSAI